MFRVHAGVVDCAIIIAMFWRRATPWAGFWGLAAGTLALRAEDLERNDNEES